MRLAEKVRRWFSNRSAKTGRYVSKGYAEKNPDTTVREGHSRRYVPPTVTDAPVLDPEAQRRLQDDLRSGRVDPPPQ